MRATKSGSADASARAPASQQNAQLSRKEATQARILDAAIALFAERGYDGASITIIAARAGVSRATVFWHFSDKANLFQEACRRMLVPFVEEFRKSLEDVDPGKRVFELFNVYELFVSRYLETIEHFVRWALESPTLRAALHKPLFTLHDQFTQDIRRAFLELWGDPAEAAELSSAFIALLDGNLLLDLMESSPEKRDLRRAGLRRLAELATAAKPLP